MTPETFLKTSVLIVGKGVSGLILAHLLEKKGIRTTLLERETNITAPILAETIPPSTLPLLNEIELLNLFENSSSRTYGYQSKWYTNEIIDESFFNYNPYKYGLKINKRKIISELEKKLTNEPLKYHQLINVVQKDNKVITSIKINDKLNLIQSNLIIDATGRNRAILKRVGIPDIMYDENLAFICYVPKQGKHLKYGFFTESFENGWGTISDLNETTRIITLYTPNKSPIHKKLNSFQNWKSILSNTTILKKHLPQNEGFKIIGKQANSSITKQIVTNRLLAIGDAAIAFDPISSHGVSNAIFCAINASKTITQFIEVNNEGVLKKYENTLFTIFDEYYKQKEKLYKTSSFQI
ncbi:FAD-dependent monooxygenase [Tenacibaculum sp.]|nr:FAD-dependent monooxygenase [Tenacibaculum sp.]